MREQIEKLLRDAAELKAGSKQEIEALKVHFLGKKGEVTKLFDQFKQVLPQEKREYGQLLNKLKVAITSKIEELRDSLLDSDNSSDSKMDLSLPGTVMELGGRHPISAVREEILSIFAKFGYIVAEGPEIEDDMHVFGALNFPPEHPARDMQDTFFITTGDNPILLRTHTSSVQVRAMEEMELPIRIVCPGRVFRNEAISARAHCIFHQVEGLYIDHGVSFADLKQAIMVFVQEFFDKNSRVRFRPSYFPFTEPSAEVDISCNICGGKGCNICKGSGWLEIMGCGMVDPNVLEVNGIDSSKYSGFAFGMGIERIAMLKWQVKDLRHYFENDIRFLKQFDSVV